MNAIEKQIYDLLCQYPQVYVSATEVSRNVGNRKWFNADRTWAKPILRRLELDGWLESNPFGEYRIKRVTESTTSFRRALEIPGMSLANTSIICLDDEPVAGTGHSDTGHAAVPAGGVHWSA
ncbi:MAG: hypothetical protein RJA22_189 [Verrucomicrobiota bacterium]|jgi:ABC-type branched-subunit amino acid transport system ATPase component